MKVINTTVIDNNTAGKMQMGDVHSFIDEIMLI